MLNPFLGFCPTEIQLSHRQSGPVLPTVTHCEQDNNPVGVSETPKSGRHAGNMVTENALRLIVYYHYQLKQGGHPAGRVSGICPLSQNNTDVIHTPTARRGGGQKLGSATRKLELET